MLCLQVEWAAKTHDLLERLWKLPCSGQLGISLVELETNLREV